MWGAAVWSSGGASTPLRFPGQYADAETGLHYNYQRYYDPGTGSYLTPDPLGLIPAPNPHAYVPNPLAAADPLGLDAGGAEAADVLARPGALGDAAVSVHNLALLEHSGKIRFNMSTVALAEVKMPGGDVQYFAAGSSGRLSSRQIDALVELGVPSENIAPGPLHAERNILKLLPEGAKVKRWGIAWGPSNRPVPCAKCRPFVKGTIEGA